MARVKFLIQRVKKRVLFLMSKKKKSISDEKGFKSFRGGYSQPNIARKRIEMLFEGDSYKRGGNDGYVCVLV